MKDTELRGIVLQGFYENRRQSGFMPKSIDFEPALDDVEITRICEQLNDHHLLDVEIHRNIEGGGVVVGRISAHGVDVVEDEAIPEIKVIFMQNNTTHISGSTNVIVGDYNQQNVTQHVEGLMKAIEASGGTPEEKAEAKSRLKRFLEHPLLSAVIGGAIALMA